LYLSKFVVTLGWIYLSFVGIATSVQSQLVQPSLKLTRLILIDAIKIKNPLEVYFEEVGNQNIVNPKEAFLSNVIIDTLLIEPYSDDWVNDFITNMLVIKERSLAANEWLQIDHLIEDSVSGQVQLFLTIQARDNGKKLDNSIPKSSIDGVLGVVPIEDSRWMIVGDLVLQIPELWKVNQALDFTFTRSDIDYTSTSLSFQQPINKRFYMNGHIELEQRDSIYQQSVLGMTGRWLANPNHRYNMSIAFENSSSSKRVQSYLDSYQGIFIQLGIFQQFTVKDWNLASHLDFSSTYQKSKQTKSQLIGRNTQWVHSLHLETVIESPKTGIGFIHLSQVYDRVWAKELPWTYAIVFGGAKTLPGFYERQFDAQWVFRIKSSYVIPLKDSDIWEFFVVAAHFKNFASRSEGFTTKQTLWSTGFSYTFETDFGNIQLALATPLWSIYSGSKLHLNVVR